MADALTLAMKAQGLGFRGAIWYRSFLDLVFSGFTFYGFRALGVRAYDLGCGKYG